MNTNFLFEVWNLKIQGLNPISKGFTRLVLTLPPFFSKL